MMDKGLPVQHRQNSLDPLVRPGRGQQALERAEPVLSRLGDLREVVLLVRSAAAMATEGTTRATVSEVTSRARDEHGLEISPSRAGQTFSSLGLRTVTSRGRNRLVLESEELEPLRDRLQERLEEMEPQVQGALESFNQLAERTSQLESRLTEAMAQARRYTEISRQLGRLRSTTRNLELMESQLQTTRAQAERVEAIRIQINQLEEVISTQGALMDRHRKLSAQVRENQAWEIEIKRSEAHAVQHRLRINRRIEDLGVKRQDLHRLSRQLAVVDVEQVLRERRQELDELLVLLGEKRSLLSRLFGRKAPAS